MKINGLRITQYAIKRWREGQWKCHPHVEQRRYVVNGNCEYKPFYSNYLKIYIIIVYNKINNGGSQ